MAECLSMGDQAGSSHHYQQLVGLQDIKSLVHLNHDAIRDILRSKTGHQELTLASVGPLEDMSGTNDAFNSSICSMELVANISEKNKDSTEAEDKKPFSFVIKSPPKLSFIKLMHKITKPFLNEVTWYLDLLGQMSLLESTVSLPGSPLHTQCPVVYHAHSNYYSGEAANSCASCPWFCWLPIRAAESGILVMENVKKRGYVMFDKMKILPLDHFLLAMTNLAHFHGRWLAYRWLGEAGSLGDQAWSLTQFKAALNTQKRVPKFMYNQLMNGTHKTVRRILQLEGLDELIDRVDKFFNHSVRLQLDQLMGNVSSAIDTCCHGDFWSNNIMFKYDDDGKVAETILVDFQLINYGHPAYDVLYMMYISTDLEFRDAHMAECLASYWNTLATYLDKFKPKGVTYDEAAFHVDLKTYKTIAFVLATTLLPNVLSGSQVDAEGLLALRDIQRKQAAELEDPENLNSKEIKRRVVGLVQELTRDNLI
jgi:hypothetical protein